VQFACFGCHHVLDLFDDRFSQGLVYLEELGLANVFVVLGHFIYLFVVEAWSLLRDLLFFDQEELVFTTEELIEIYLHGWTVHDEVRDVVVNVGAQPLAESCLGLTIVEHL